MSKKPPFKSCDRPKAKRNGSHISAYIPAHLRKYLRYRVDAENGRKNMTKILIEIITKEMNADKFYIK